jgi:Flp pilus assembly protein TadB
LDIAGVKLSPEAYVLKAYITSILVALCAVPAGLVMPLFIPILIGLAVALWFSTYYSAFDFVKKRKKRMEAEIPRFALTIAQSLENDRDVLRILTFYRRVAGNEFGLELDKTIADMKTGNYENALIRFESRVGSALLSDVIRGLIGTLRGEDQRIYFKMICYDMRQIEQSKLKKEAAKRPKKMQWYSMLMLFCIIIIYVVVLSTEVIGSLGVFFG